MAATPAYRTVRLGAIDIAYLDQGTGDAVLLVHGFASSAAVNWQDTGWIAAVANSGRRAIALDNRGHGRSGKLYDPADYALAPMAGDALALLDRLGIERADLIGYSMGARICATATLAVPARVRSLTLGGIGGGLMTGTSDAERIAAALEASNPAEVTDPRGRMFRSFADRTGSDLAALAACMRARNERVAVDRLAALSIPMLIAIGTADEVAGSPEGLTRHLPRAELLLLPAKDHMKAVGDPRFKRGFLEFLDRRP